MFSEEELAALLQMGDISGAEQNVARQVALAERLRSAPFMSKQRTDVGSNIGRAAGGIASALNDYGASKAQKELTPMRRDILMRLSEALRKKRAGAQTYAADMPSVPQGTELY